MDDVLLWSDERAKLHAAADAVRTFLGDELRLELKERATMLAPTSCGAPFLGFLVFPRLLRVRPENLRRYRWRLRYRRWQLERGVLDADAYRHAVTAVLAHLAHGSTLALRLRWFDDHTLEL